MPAQQFPQSALPTAHVGIGDCCLSLKPVLFATVLGSCVSVTFFHPGRRAGGMFHAMLPQQALARSRPRPCMFADSAVACMLERFRAHGMRAGDLQVKLFGGGNTMLNEHPEAMREMLDVGRKNVDNARAALTTHGLSPMTEDVLGAKGRKLFFSTLTGEVWLRYLSDELSRAVAAREFPKERRLL
jgi:chemotaxis protein CheD